MFVVVVVFSLLLVSYAFFTYPTSLPNFHFELVWRQQMSRFWNYWWNSCQQYCCFWKRCHLHHFQKKVSCKTFFVFRFRNPFRYALSFTCLFTRVPCFFVVVLCSIPVLVSFVLSFSSGRKTNLRKGTPTASSYRLMKRANRVLFLFLLMQRCTLVNEMCKKFRQTHSWFHEHTPYFSTFKIK